MAAESQTASFGKTSVASVERPIFGLAGAAGTEGSRPGLPTVGPPSATSDSAAIQQTRRRGEGIRGMARLQGRRGTSVEHTQGNLARRPQNQIIVFCRSYTTLDCVWAFAAADPRVR